MKFPLCDKFQSTPGYNPATGRSISTAGKVSQFIQTLCKNPSGTCSAHDRNPLVNPLTGRAISANSKIFERFETFCKAEYDRSRAKVDVASVHDTKQCTKYSGVTLKQHQTHVSKYLLQNEDIRGMLLFHGTGSGKTMLAATLIRCLMEKYPGKRALVITPTSLVQNFHKEVDRLQLQSTFEDKVDVMSYGKVVHAIQSGALSPRSKALRNTILVIDEAHNLRTPIIGDGGKIAREIFKLTSRAFKVILLTATPVQNRIDEFANLYAMIHNEESMLLRNPSKYYDDFTTNFSPKSMRGHVSHYDNPTDDNPDYPRSRSRRITFEMTKKYYKLYKVIEDDNADFFGENLHFFLNGVRRASNTIDTKVPTPKVLWTIDHIRSAIDGGKKVLVYSNYLESGVQLVQNELKKKSIPFVEVSGSLTSAQRASAVARYNANDVHVMFVTAAGTEGLDLKGTRSVIIMEPHWNSERIKQIIGRAVRYQSHSHLPARQRSVTVYHLVLRKPKGVSDGKKSADEYLYKLAKTKEHEILRFYDGLIANSIERK